MDPALQRIHVHHPGLLKITRAVDQGEEVIFDDLSSLAEGRIESDVIFPLLCPATINVTILTGKTYTYKIPWKAPPPPPEEQMKLVLLNAEVTLVEELGIDDPIDWTTLDIAGQVSAKATHAYLRVKLQHNGPLIDGDAGIGVREIGSAQAMDVVHDWLLHAKGQTRTNDCFVTLDDAKRFQWHFTRTAGATDFYMWIWLVGYLELV